MLIGLVIAVGVIVGVAVLAAILGALIALVLWTIARVRRWLDWRSIARLHRRQRLDLRRSRRNGNNRSSGVTRS